MLASVVPGCSFPRPQDVAGDASPGEDAASSMVCVHDQDCSAEAPFCVDSACSPCQAACPDSAPICDTSSHACRGCNKDSECDSGACDLAANACVNQGSILYATPNGIDADDCTRAAPCGFAKAAASVDAAHPYIVLTPGTYLHGGFFDGKIATICGSGATISASSGINMTHNSSIRLRNMKFQDPNSNTPVFRGAGEEIIADGDLTLDDVDMSAGSLVMILGGSSTTIRNSRFTGAGNTFTGMILGGHVVIDRSEFTSCFVQYGGSTTQGTMEISNSVFIGDIARDTARPSILFNSTSDTTSLGTATIYNNTFKDGAIACNGAASAQKLFIANVFYTTASLTTAAGCAYRNSTCFPAKVSVETTSMQIHCSLMQLATTFT